MRGQIRGTLPMCRWLLLTLCLLISPLTMAQSVSYSRDIQPIFTHNCVACHACYDAPCQLNLGSGEGAERGASKATAYDGTRTHTQATTRLFMDAHGAPAWRRKDFHSVLEQQGGQAALMARMLELGHATPLPPNSKLPKNLDIGIERANQCALPGEFADFASLANDWLQLGDETIDRRGHLADLVAGEHADLPAIAHAEGGELGPGIRARNAVGRGGHLDREQRCLAAQRGGEVGREGAGHRHAGEPRAHVGDGRDRVDRRAACNIMWWQLCRRRCGDKRGRGEEDGVPGDHGSRPPVGSPPPSSAATASLAPTGPLASASKKPPSSPAPVRNCCGLMSPVSSFTAW